MKIGLVLVVATLLLSGCTSKQQSSQVAKLQSQVNSLAAQVKQLQQQVQSQSRPEWVLWKRIAIIKEGGGIVAGLPPAKPVSAFSTKKACEESARSVVARKVRSSSGTAYLMNYKDGEVDKVYYSCLPRGVNVRF